MRKLIASTFVSLDGVLRAPGGPRGKRLLENGAKAGALRLVASKLR